MRTTHTKCLARSKCTVILPITIGPSTSVFLPPPHQHLSGFRMPCSACFEQTPVTLRGLADRNNTRRDNSISALTLLCVPDCVTPTGPLFPPAERTPASEGWRSRRWRMGSSLREKDSRALWVLAGRGRVCTCVLSRQVTSQGVTSPGSFV